MNDGKRWRPGFYTLSPAGLLDASVMVTSLSAENVDEFNALYQVIFDLQPITRAMEMAELAVIELHQTLRQMADRTIELSHSSFNNTQAMHENYVTLLLRATSCLSSFRSFLDYTETTLTRLFGRSSEEFSTYKDETRRLYDAHFSYRFLYELRHMSQHVTIPLSNIGLQMQRSAQDETISYEVKLQLFRDKLLSEWSKWKPKVRSEIEQNPPEFDFLPLLDEKLTLLKCLCRTALMTRQNDIVECSRYHSVLLGIIKPPPLAVPVVWVGESLSPNDPPAGMKVIPSEELRRLLLLLR